MFAAVPAQLQDSERPAGAIDVPSDRHEPRAHDGLLHDHANAHRRLRELNDPVVDRGLRHGIPAHERVEVLDDAVRTGEHVIRSAEPRPANGLNNVSAAVERDL